MMFDYRRRAIQLSEELFCSILERFKKKVNKLEYPEYSSYTKEMYRKYDQIMDQLDKLFQKVESANQTILEAQKNQFLFLQLMKFSQEAKSYAQIEEIIKGTSQLGPIEQYLFKFYKIYFANRQTLKAIETLVSSGEGTSDVVTKVGALTKDLSTANALLHQKEKQILQFKAIIEKMSGLVNDKMKEYDDIFTENEVLNAEIERLRDVNKKENQSFSALATLNTNLEHQIQEMHKDSQQQITSIKQSWSLNSDLVKENDKISYENQMMNQAINRLNQKLKQINEQYDSIRTIKTALEAQSKKHQEKIVMLSENVLAMSKQCGNIYDKNEELSEKNERFQALVVAQAKEKDVVCQQIDNMKKDMAMLKIQYEQKCQQLKIIANLNETLQEQKRHMAGIIENIDNFVIEKTAEKDQLLAKNQEIRKEMDSLMATTKRQNQEIDKFFVNNNELGAEINSLKELNRKLTQEKEEITCLQKLVAKLTQEQENADRVQKLNQKLSEQKEGLISQKILLEELNNQLQCNIQKMAASYEESKQLYEKKIKQNEKLSIENREVSGNLQMMKKLFQIQKSEYMALMDIESSLQSKNRHYKSMVQELKAQITKKTSELEQSYLNTSQLQKEHALMHQQLAYTRSQLQKTEQTYHRYQADMHALNEQNKRMIQKVSQENKELLNLKEDYWALSSQYSTMKENHNLSIKNFTEQINSLTKEYENLTRECNQNEAYLYDKISNLTEAKSKLLEHAHHLQNELHQKANLIHGISNEKSVQEVKMQELESNIHQAAESMNKLKRRLEKYEPAQESWIIMGEETTEIIIEERAV